MGWWLLIISANRQRGINPTLGIGHNRSRDIWSQPISDEHPKSKMAATFMNDENYYDYDDDYDDDDENDDDDDDDDDDDGAGRTKSAGVSCLKIVSFSLPPFIG